MIPFAGRGILLDIEGTTSSIDFVYEQMFPYVRRELQAFLQQHWDQPAVVEACRQIAADAGADWTAWSAGADARARVQAEVLRLMDDDVKATGLKQLQGLIWRDGFESGQLRAHLYADVLPALDAWRRAGKQLRVYSSGSVQAQLLFFGHTELGDVRDRFDGHYDTTTGGKKDSASYTAIAADWGLPPAELLFVSDVAAELDAAAAAGLQTALSVRPGNPSQGETPSHPRCATFAEIDVR